MHFCPHLAMKNPRRPRDLFKNSLLSLNSASSWATSAYAKRPLKVCGDLTRARSLSITKASRVLGVYILHKSSPRLPRYVKWVLNDLEIANEDRNYQTIFVKHIL